MNSDQARQINEKVENIVAKLTEYQAAEKTLFATSSFQTHSLPLLAILSKIRPRIPIVFLDTGYLFPETLKFRDEITAQLDLKLINIRPSVPKSDQRTPDGRLLFAADPNKCCHLNKVLPLEPFLHQHDIWITGVRADQTQTRAHFSWEQPGPHETTRFHPMLDWTAREIFEYRKQHSLPEHPLEKEGYLTVGCMPCTVPYLVSASEREGRWTGQQKTECGLHTELATKTTNPQ